MFNQGPRYSDDYLLQEDYESDNDQEDTPHGNLDEEVSKIAATIRLAAFSSCISAIVVEDDYTLVKTLWGQVQGIVRKPLFREVALISAILLFKTSLFVVYRTAKKQGLEIVNL